MSVHVEVKQEFRAKMQEFMSGFTKSIAEDVRDEAKSLCPVDSGRLRDSIKVSGSGDEFSVGSELDYSGVVEYGSLHQNAQPFLRPALEKVIDEHQG